MCVSGNQIVLHRNKDLNKSESSVRSAVEGQKRDVI